MRKKTKLTKEVEQYVLEHYKVDTVEKMSKDLNFDTKVLREYIESVQKLTVTDESPAVQKAKKHVTVMTKSKSQALDQATIKDDKISFNKPQEVTVDPKRVFVRPD